MRFLRLLPLSALMLCACEKPREEVDSKPEPQLTAEEVAEMEAKIEELEREIETSTQVISDLDAALMMELTKIEDDPEYDDSFLQEIINDQERERSEIKEAQRQLNELAK